MPQIIAAKDDLLEFTTFNRQNAHKLFGAKPNVSLARFSAWIFHLKLFTNSSPIIPFSAISRKDITACSRILAKFCFYTKKGRNRNKALPNLKVG